MNALKKKSLSHLVLSIATVVFIIIALILGELLIRKEDIWSTEESYYMAYQAAVAFLLLSIATAAGSIGLWASMYDQNKNKAFLIALSILAAFIIAFILASVIDATLGINDIAEIEDPYAAFDCFTGIGGAAAIATLALSTVNFVKAK